MGYSISCIESRFHISKPKAALAALKTANRKRPLFRFEEVTSEVEAAATISEVLQACCWDVEEDENGDIAALFYEGKLLTSLEDVERLFDLLAPFVRTGSFLVIHGDEDACWRYFFKNGKLRIEEGSAEE